jgi:hypothetical protein
VRCRSSSDSPGVGEPGRSRPRPQATTPPECLAPPFTRAWGSISGVRSRWFGSSVGEGGGLWLPGCRRTVAPASGCARTAWCWWLEEPRRAWPGRTAMIGTGPGSAEPERLVGDVVRLRAGRRHWRRHRCERRGRRGNGSREGGHEHLGHAVPSPSPGRHRGGASLGLADLTLGGCRARHLVCLVPVARGATSGTGPARGPPPCEDARRGHGQWGRSCPSGGARREALDDGGAHGYAEPWAPPPNRRPAAARRVASLYGADRRSDPRPRRSQPVRPGVSRWSAPPWPSWSSATTWASTRGHSRPSPKRSPCLSESRRVRSHAEAVSRSVSARPVAGPWIRNTTESSSTPTTIEANSSGAS